MPRRRNGRRHEDQGNVFDALQLLEHRLAGLAGADAMAEQFHVVGQGPQRRLVVAVARALQANDQPHAMQDVFFLPLDAADIADLQVGDGHKRPTPVRRRSVATINA